MTWIYNATPEQEALSKFPTIISINVVFTLMMMLVVAVRLWIRRRTLASDDWITVVTAGFCIAYNGMCIVQTRWGLGLPTAARPKEDLETFAKLSYAGKPWYQFGIAGFKLALCISYLRLTDGSDKRFYRWVIIFVGAFSTICHFVFLCIVLFFCDPIKKNWLSKTPGYCLPFGPTNYTMASLTILFDVIIFLLPIPLFISLNLNGRMKLSLCFLFSLGLLTTLCSIIRATYLPNVAYGDGDNSMVVMLGTVEFNVGIIVSCLPFLRPLFKSLRDWHSRTYGSSKNRSNIYRMDEIGRSGTHGTRTGQRLESKIGRSDSEEEILGINQRDIVKTVHYEVHSDGMETPESPGKPPYRKY